MEEVMNQEEEVIREKQIVSVEVLLLPTCTEDFDFIESSVLSFLESQCSNYSNGPIDFSRDIVLVQNIKSIKICDISETAGSIPFWSANLQIHIYTLNEEGSMAETLDGASDVTAYHEWMLPCTEFHELWDHLVFDDSIKTDLLQYASSAFFFSQHHVNPSIISLNHVILLHGPPGTGKTSLCKALAQKLAIHYYSSFSHIALIEINSHSLFSKWFSESGKLVMKLFDYIHELLLDHTTMLFILIGYEVESLSASRKASLSGSEPSDGMRVVNALLTQIDKLRNNPNVMILATSNLSSCIDDAFVDRADIKRFIGNPGEQGRYIILQDCINELSRTGVLKDNVNWKPFTQLNEECEEDRLLISLVKESEEFSGRTLRKLPFTTYSKWCCGREVTCNEFIYYMKRCIEQEKQDRSLLQ